MSLRHLMLLASLLPGIALAATVRVPADQPTIQAAIDAAATGDTVLVFGGPYEVHGLVARSGVTLRGATGGSAGVVLFAQQAGRILDCNGVTDVVIENFTFQGGEMTTAWYDDAGAGVRCLNAAVRITDCRFVANRASVGGGLGVRDSQVTVERCEFHANEARHAAWTGGGGVWCRSSTGSFRDCSFTDNTAYSQNLPGDGGGLFTEDSGFEVANCRFSGNAAGAGGGGFYSVFEDSSVVTDCAFEGNSATWGGAAYLEECTADMVRCTFTGNTAAQGSGAVETLGSDNELIDCVFVGNATTLYDGGAIQAWNGALLLDRCEFRDNTAPSGGGAVRLWLVDAVIRDSVFDHNVSSRGPGLTCYYSAPTLQGCTFVGHTPSAAGSCIYLGADSSAEFANCIIASGTRGASIAGVAGMTVTLTCCDVWGNPAGDWIGAFASQLGTAGNLSADPMFCDPAAGDYTISGFSPCSPYLNPDCGLIGALGVGCPPVDVPSANASTNLALGPNVPNPFNPATEIHLALPAAGAVRIEVYDLAGRRVRTLLDESRPAGALTVIWDGRDDAGRAVAAGVYHCTASSAGQRAAIRMALVK